MRIFSKIVYFYISKCFFFPIAVPYFLENFYKSWKISHEEMISGDIW